MDRSVCKRCKKKSIIFDTSSSAMVCSLCGCMQEFNDYRSHFDAGFTENTGKIVYSGAVRSYVSESHKERVYIHGSSDFRERKIFQAQQQIEDITKRLGLSGQRSREVKSMIEEITEGEFGQGDWFLVLVAAVSYVIIRKNHLPSSIVEVSSLAGCEAREVGRMVVRVTKFLNLSLPGFDMLVFFERAVRSCPSLSEVSKDKIDIIVKQGRFLLTCCVKWFLTTGRHPLPIIAAVLTFVAEVNQVKLAIAEVAKEVYAGPATSKLRYKELKETLVEAAKDLPWGKDVTVKNLVWNAPSVLGYLEMKSKLIPSLEPASLDSPITSGFDLQEILGDCLMMETDYMEDCSSSFVQLDHYMNEHQNELLSDSLNDIVKLKLSEDCLWKAYTDFINGNVSAIESSIVSKKKRRRGGTTLKCTDWWAKKSSFMLRHSLEELIKDNGGFDALPPSFIAGREACKRRKEKIAAAKKRISEIMHPTLILLEEKKEISLQEKLQLRKMQSLDWEDCIIELLLLHQVSEDEIEQGHYNTLLDLHVFNSFELSKKPSVRRANASVKH